MDVAWCGECRRRRPTPTFYVHAIQAKDQLPVTSRTRVIHLYLVRVCVYTSSVPVLLPYPREMLVIEMHAVWSQTIVRQRRDVLQYVRVVRISITRYHQVWFDDPKKYLV